MKISRQVKPNQIENFMKSTNGLTQTAQTSGGVLFTSWLEKDSNGPIMARSDDTLPSSLTNDQDFNDISTDEIIDGKFTIVRNHVKLGVISKGTVLCGGCWLYVGLSL